LFSLVLNQTALSVRICGLLDLIIKSLGIQTNQSYWLITGGILRRTSNTTDAITMSTHEIS